MMAAQDEHEEQVLAGREEEGREEEGREEEQRCLIKESGGIQEAGGGCYVPAVGKEGGQRGDEHHVLLAGGGQDSSSSCGRGRSRREGGWRKGEGEHEER